MLRRNQYVRRYSNRSRRSFSLSGLLTRRRISALLLIFLLLGAWTVFRPASDSAVDSSPAPQAELSAVEEPFMEAPPAEPEVQLPAVEHINGTIARGQTASSLLEGYLSPGEIYALADACEDVYPLTRLKVGRPYCIVEEDGRFAGFEYEIDRESILVVSSGDDGFEVGLKPIEYDVRIQRVSGTINSSLFLAVSDAGEKATFAMSLADMFGWEIDFIHDIRTGDSFRALVEKRYREGEFSGYGRILAAEFVNQGETYEGFLHAEGEQSGYYNSEGRNLRKAFLKAPLSFTRISSGFNLRRLHPIKKVVRPHPAIDYAAPKGTPVKAIGDGTVIKVAYDRAAGNHIKIRHANGYESAYLHLSGYARGLKRGKKVRQGQLIGYVGSTGLSTGPHLDFRMKRYGKYVNPRRIKNPRADSLSEEALQSFGQEVARFRAMLRGDLALNE